MAGGPPRTFIYTDGIQINKISFDYVKLTLTSAQILALPATPIDLGISAPGAGKFIQIIGATAQLNFNTIAYAALAPRLLLRNSTGVVSQCECNELLTGTVTRRMVFNIGINTGTAAQTGIIENDTMVVTSNIPVTLGNSTIDIICIYSIVGA